MRKTVKLAAVVAGIVAGVTIAGIASAGRDSSGTFTFGAVSGGYPIQPGVISRTGMNANLGEVAAALTDSASRSGQGGFTAPVRGADGSASLPAFSWTNDTNTGFFRPGTDTIGVSLAGTDYLDFATTRIWSGLNLEFSGASDRFVVQSGTARLFLGTSSGNNSDVGLQRNGTIMLGLTSTIEANSNRITGVADPSAAQDAATKAYVDAYTAAASMATGGTGWTISTNSVRKRSGIVTVNIVALAGASGGWSSIATLPAGYRPGETFIAWGRCYDGSTTFGCEINIDSDGVVSAVRYDNGSSLVAMWALGSDDSMAFTFTFIEG